MDATPTHAQPPFAEAFARNASALTRAELRVAQYLREHPETAVVSSAAELGRLTTSSDATVLRTVKALGYPGLHALQSALVEHLRRHQDLRTEVVAKVRPPAEGTEPGSVLTEVLRDSVRQMQEMLARPPDEDWSRTGAILDAARQVVCIGLGTAGPIAEWLAIALTRLGTQTTAVTEGGLLLADRLALLREGDAVVVFCPLRMFRSIGAALDHARGVGASSVVVTEALTRELRHRADVVLTAPPSTSGVGSETLAPGLIAQAMSIELGRTRSTVAAANAELLDQLRAKINGRSPAG